MFIIFYLVIFSSALAQEDLNKFHDLAGIGTRIFRSTYILAHILDVRRNLRFS